MLKKWYDRTNRRKNFTDQISTQESRTRTLREIGTDLEAAEALEARIDTSNSAPDLDTVRTDIEAATGRKHTGKGKATSRSDPTEHYSMSNERRHSIRLNNWLSGHEGDPALTVSIRAHRHSISDRSIGI
jgi:hypothetical protein